MPSLDEHVRRSSERTGEDWRQLNQWLDGDYVPLLKRFERHLLVKKYSKYVADVWGEKGLQEYRNHVDDDLRTFRAVARLILRRNGSSKRGEVRHR